METKLYFLRDDFDNTYKLFTTTKYGQNLLLGKIKFAPDPDFKWEMMFMEWLCSHTLPREIAQ